MKCPKCDYLGFETGDRCKNCGYDFSLLSIQSEPPDYEIHPASLDDVPVHDIRDEDNDVVDDALRITLTPEPPFEQDSSLELGPDFAKAVTTPEPEPEMTPGGIDEPPLASPVVPFIASAATSTSNAALPLFTPAQEDEEDDEPLIKLPAAPRPPLAVRRTPDTPRLRAVPTRAPARRSFSEGGRPSPAPVLQFAEELEHETPEPAPPQRVEPVASGIITGQPSHPGARIVAVLIDYLILLGIDAAVVYFTVRMAGLAPNEWRLLPVAPMLTFLGLLKVAYFYAFTAVGGQTIGKMAVGTCVVADGGTPVDAARAMRRTFAGLLSFLLLGLGFIPALFGDHRALHDRLAGTRVVRLRSV